MRATAKPRGFAPSAEPLCRLAVTICRQRTVDSTRVNSPLKDRSGDCETQVVPYRASV